MAIDVGVGEGVVLVVGVEVGADEVVVVALLQELNNVSQVSRSVVHMTLV